MPFVRRNAQGRIEAIFDGRREGADEELPADSPEIVQFLQSGDGDQPVSAAEWIQSDLALARVLEDVVDLLIAKGVIQFTDLPIPAQQKLMGRHGLRRELDYVAKLFPDTGDDDELF